MAANYVLLERIELNASAASITFANIPQTGYTDLKIVSSARTSASDQNIKVTFNGTSTNYSERWLYGSGSAAGSGSATTNGYFYIHYATNSTNTASTFGNSEIYIPNYTSSNYKSISEDAIQETNATAAFAALGAGLWSNIAAITTIALTPLSGNFDQYSTFSLYGLAAVGTTPTIAPKASGGNVIDYDGTYWIHTFNTSGTFTPAVGLTCDYLVVAGGGGGSGGIGAGGGAGGLRSTVTATGGGGSLESALSVASGTAYTVTVGAGGARNASRGALASNGANSVFSTITSTGGGGAGSATNQSTPGGSVGGSGGGRVGVGATGAAGTANQGFAGGGGVDGSVAFTATGGGGGASAVGASGTGTSGANSTGGAGGAGVATSITGSSVTYAGGGGGAGDTNQGAGGSGGGGAAGYNSGTDGTANLGGGGGGAANGASFQGGNGGSGIVIIRYLAA